MKAFQHSPAGRRRTAAALLATAVVLGGAGAAAAAAAAAVAGGDGGGRSGHGHVTAGPVSDDDHGGRRHDDSAAPAAPDDDRVLVRGATVDVKRAVDTAVKAVDGVVVSVELEGRTSGPVWEAELVDAAGTEREVVVDARTGAVIATGPHHRDDDDRHRDDGHGSD